MLGGSTASQDEIMGLFWLDEEEAPDPEENENTEEARRIWNEYISLESGISYQAMGYHTGDGIEIPAFKIDEHNLVSQLNNAAVEEKYRRIRKRNG